MNDHYVCIKVDREERPDVDAIYMSAVQALTGSGGWPMSVWLTPDARAVLRRHLLPAARRRARRAPRLPDRAARACTTTYRADPDRGASARPPRWWARSASAWRRAPRAGAAPSAPPASLIADTVDGLQAAFDDRDGGAAARAEVPVEHAGPPAAARHRAHGRRRGAAHGDADAGEDGGGRHVRPARRRLPPLLDRRALAGAALREDAVRQRAAGRGVRRGVPGDRARRLRARRARDARLRAARDDRARGRLLFGDRRRLGGPDGKSEEGEVLRLVGGGDPAACWAPAPRPSASSATTASPPAATSRARTSSHVAAPTPTTDEQAALAAAARGAVRGAAPARAAAAARREDPGRLERPDDLGGWRWRGRILGEPRYVEAAARAADVRARPHAPGRAARAQLQGRRAGRRRLPRGLRVRRARVCSICYEATFERRWLARRVALADETERLFADRRAAGS